MEQDECKECYKITGSMETCTGVGRTSIPIKDVVTHFTNTALYTSPRNSLTFNNLNSMHRNQQVKVAVFGVKRTEDGNIQSSKFIKELWVERKEGISIELVVAKELDSDYNPEEIVVKEIYNIRF